MIPFVNGLLIGSGVGIRSGVFANWDGCTSKKWLGDGRGYSSPFVRRNRLATQVLHSKKKTS